MIIPTLLRNQDVASQEESQRRTDDAARKARNVRTAPPAQKEVSYLLSAAVVNRRFAECLMTDRAQALDIGYAGRRFQFSHADRERILGIRASTFQEFAGELHKLFPVRPELL